MKPKIDPTMLKSLLAYFPFRLQKSQKRSSESILRSLGPALIRRIFESLSHSDAEFRKLSAFFICEMAFKSLHAQQVLL